MQKNRKKNDKNNEMKGNQENIEDKTQQKQIILRQML